MTSVDSSTRRMTPCLQSGDTITEAYKGKPGQGWLATSTLHFCIISNRKNKVKYGKDNAEQPVPLEVLISWLIYKTIIKDPDALEMTKELCVDLISTTADTACHEEVLDWMLTSFENGCEHHVIILMENLTEIASQTMKESKKH